eukprot:TRINITY_DN66165_c0_g1_i1.p1 TRINITY_DN66165_c0_g1~~TRINITY_DN66165_c0_g1_i1.p1  ORF type:complete len:123 (+),score=1.71 TRINITY_DN66165_c0_g1_i1:587-955(+)
MLAPEILQTIKRKTAGSLFDEKKTDIFALGVTLFQSLFLRTPFAKEYASTSDPMFKHFYSGNTEEFWKLSELQNIFKFLDKFEDFRKEEFIDLLNKMLNVDPEQRISIKEVINHPWFKVHNA